MQLPDDWDSTFGGNGLLVGANLAEAVLSAIDLGGADMRNACLVGADLYLAFLQRANLSGANLERACLQGADLEEADLRNSNLSYADLGRGNMGKITRLEGANLMGANLWSANLAWAFYDATTIFPDGFNPSAHGMLTREEFDRL